MEINVDEEDYTFFEIENANNLLQVGEIKYKNYKFEKMNAKIEEYSLEFDLVKLFDTFEMNHSNLFTDINISISYFTKRIKTSQYNKNLILERERTNNLFIKNHSMNSSLGKDNSLRTNTKYDSFRNWASGATSIVDNKADVNYNNQNERSVWEIYV